LSRLPGTMIGAWRDVVCCLLCALDLNPKPVIRESPCHEIGGPYRRRQKCTNAPRRSDSVNRTLAGLVSESMVAVWVYG